MYGSTISKGKWKIADVVLGSSFWWYLRFAMHGPRSKRDVRLSQISFQIRILCCGYVSECIQCLLFELRCLSRRLWVLFVLMNVMSNQSNYRWRMESLSLFCFRGVSMVWETWFWYWEHFRDTCAVMRCVSCQNYCRNWSAHDESVCCCCFEVCVMEKRFSKS